MFGHFKAGKNTLLAHTILAASQVATPAALLAATLAVAPAALAQDLTTGSIQGKVTDTAGAPVAGASVLVTGPRGFSRTVTTDSLGQFRLSSVSIGSYDVEISKSGFDTVSDSGVSVSIGATTALDIGLKSQMASTEEEIVVVGSRRKVIDYSDNSTGITVDVQDTFDRLPIARSSEALQLLAPTATIGDSAFGTANRGVVSLGGASVAENIFYVNGMNITNFRTFVGGNTIPFEMYDQVEVKTGGYSAEYGRATGGAVIAVTRSGTDEWHGGASVYASLDGLRARQPNTSTSLNELDSRESKEANIWLSGPLWKDRAYFFGFYNPREVEIYDVFADLDPVTGTRGGQTAELATEDEPYYGGKLDLILAKGHRVELTYLKDESLETLQNYEFTGGRKTKLGDTFTQNGGETRIAKYTGDFTDWLTVSVLYGDNTYGRSSNGTLDGEASVWATLNGAGAVVPSLGGAGNVVRGNPNLTVEAGSDKRELLRADADVFFNLYGEHNVRVGFDQETLSAIASTAYSGGVYYRYYLAGATGALSGLVAPNTPYVRVRRLNSGGSFESENTAWYIQDDWAITDKLNLNLGVRNEKFVNKNASGNPFTTLEDQVALRLGATYDPTGEGKTKWSAFYGRYYLPVAANTNIRLAGNERFTQDWHLFSSINATTLVPTLTNPAILQEVLSDSNNASPVALIAKNLEPQYQDEFMVGYEHEFENKWKVGASLVYRDLKSVLEDFDMAYIQENFCASSARPAGLSVAACNAGAFGGGGDYVLINPGKDIPTVLQLASGAFVDVTVPAAIADLPEAKREFWSLELSFERPWDGKWGLQGSYVWSKTEGNYEGGVKSDNGQDDTGLTQDFDEPGWMDGSSGLLPNSREHTIKLFGSYAATDNLIFGGNLSIQSGRNYGCIGVYPFSDGRASTTTLTSWYCNGVLTPRGSQFEGATVTRFDVNAVYKVPTKFGSATLRADVFNLFDFDRPVDYIETGEDAGGSVDPFYGTPSSYQAPRSVRLGLSWEF